MSQQQKLAGTAGRGTENADVILSAAGESHRGLLRKKNEDSFCVVYSGDGKCILAVVADGIGGHSRGEVASYICCRELAHAFLKNIKNLTDAEKAKRFLSEELEKINSSVYQRNRANRGLKRPMGTTVNAVVFLEDSLVMANAGDSRLYQLLPEKDELKQLSTDHSFKAAVAAVPGKERFKGMENVIYRAVGLHRNFEIELKDFPLVSGSRYFVCTDGMYRYLPENTLLNTLRNADLPRNALDVFMRTALVGGGKDNITGIAVFAGGGKDE